MRNQQRYTGASRNLGKVNSQSEEAPVSSGYDADEALVWEQAHKQGYNLLGTQGNYRLVDSNTGLIVGNKMTMAEVLNWLHNNRFSNNNKRNRYDDTRAYDAAA